MNLAVGPGGVLSLTDYFQPYDYQNLDGGDQDFGSGGVALLDPTVFKGTGVSKMAITAGKNGKIYIMNANNLGGYKLGPGQTDGIIQTIVTTKAVFGGVGSYPLEGGYFYVTPVGYPTYVYKLGFDGSGVPVFSLAGQTTENSAGRVGVGIPTVTSYQNKVGTGILWMCDPDAGLRAWYAVPGSDNKLKTINLPQVNGLNKFQRPAFGDSRLYVTDSQGTLYCLGSPVNLPLNCTSPVSFGQVALGSQSTQTVSCKANIAITQITSVTVGDLHFKVNPADLPQGAIAQGTTFTFPVTWDLTGTTSSNTANASYGNVSPGVKSTALTLTTTNSVAGYSTKFPISLTGTEVSNKPFLVISPITVDYGGVVLLSNQTVPSISQPFVIANAGQSPLTITGYAYTTDALTGTTINYTNVTFSNSNGEVLGDGFSSTKLPAVGTQLVGGSQVSVDSSFLPSHGVGSYQSFFTTWTTGGKVSIILEGSASTAPVGNFSISTAEGGWLPGGNLIMDFGSVAPSSTSSRKIRICNSGGSVLHISKSKPPNGVFRPEDPTALHESQSIAVNDCAYATVLFITNAEEVNIPDQTFTNTWTLNTDDLSFGVHEVQITGVVVDRKVGPTNSTGQPVYTYLGCYHEVQPSGRLLPSPQYADANNDNGRCQTSCKGGNFVFSGTEYARECYCGNTPPPSQYLDAADIQCNYACTGDASQACGGSNVNGGGYISIYYDATRYTPGSNASTGGGGSNPGAPVTVQQAGNYNYIGCYSEATTGRALSDKAPAAPTAGGTIESCQSACQGYTYFGMEYSNECFCGNTINAGSVAQTSTTPATNGCSMLCGGNTTEYCGGPNRLNMYAINGSLPLPTTSTSTTSIPSGTGNSTMTSATPTPTPTGPITVQTLTGWTYLGCYSEATNSRALTGLGNPAAAVPVTVESCSAACSQYVYFGVEYSGECYCGNTINAGSNLVGGTTPGVTGCSMICKGNATEYCGGGNRLNMYEVAASSSSSSSSIGTSTISSSSGTSTISTSTIGNLTTSASTSGTASSSLISVNSTSSSTSGTVLSTLISGTASSLTSATSSSISGTSKSTSASSTSSSTSGTATSTLASSTSTSASATPTTTSPTSTTATSTTTSSTTFVPTPGQTINSWAYLGCANETAPRALSGASFTNSTGMTVEACQSFCSSPKINYGLAGIEYGQECFCGNGLQNYAAVGQTGCNMACKGNTSEICGGSSRLSVYNLTTYVPPTTVKQVGSYVFQGCYKEATTGRALSGASYINATAMTVESCVNYCQAAGANYAGVEYSKECFCGSSIASTATAAASNSSCNMLCAGNSKEFCGAGSLLDIYLNTPGSVNAAGTPATMNTANPAIVAANTTSPKSKRVWFGIDLEALKS